jgi:type I restriction-modification system DNA methylase subunit
VRHFATAEGRIRQGLLEGDLVEAVVGLAPNLFYGTGIPAAVTGKIDIRDDGREEVAV